MKRGSKAARVVVLGFVLIAGLAVAGCESSAWPPSDTDNHTTMDNSSQAQKNAKAYPDGAAAGNGAFLQPMP